jgi:medium-chain acyl-[acyl-carrier-protein] hydrolase
MEDFKQVLTPESYSRQVELTFADCDCRERMRLSAMLSTAATFGGFDYDARGLTHEKLLEEHQAFLLSQVALRIHRRPKVRDVLTVTTWENGAKGAHMLREYELRDGSGAICVSIRSRWILVDPESRRILRPSAFTAKPLGHCPRELDCPEPQRISLPREGMETLGERRVQWSDLDGNGHLYSGRYGDIISDALPSDLREGELREFFIQYSKEALLDQTLHLAGVREDSTFRMEGRCGDNACFEALCIF